MENTQVAGEVFLDRSFVFPDTGEVAAKYIVVICESILDSQMSVAVRTTSQQHQKQEAFGCFQNEHPSPYFYVGEVDSIFPVKTWLMLDYVTEYNDESFIGLEKKGTLSVETTAQILVCVESNDSGKLYNYITKSAENELNLFKKSGLIINRSKSIFIV